MQQSFWGDVIVGASLGPVFSSCSPTYFLIIASILPASLLAGTAYLFAYAAGLCVTLLIVAVAGQKFLQKVGIAADPKGWLRRGIGVLFLLIGLAIAFSLDQKFELAFANANFLDISTLEQHLLKNSGPVTAGQPQIAPGASYADSSTLTIGAASTTSTSSPMDAKARIAAKALIYPRTPEITNASGYLNTNGSSITFAGLKGKVVLIDFWDYSCINCEREIPFVEAWYKKYSGEGLEIVGVHTPEFAFEKVASNVAAAAKSLGITYPIVLDNDYGTWNAFGNEYWPQIYLVDSDGFVVYSHSGEGDYAQTEAAIQKALKERNTNEGLSTTVSSGTVNPSGAITDPDQIASPETYFGSNRNQFLANGTQGQQGTQQLSVPETLYGNALYLGGSWNFHPEYAETSDTSAKIVYKFTARDVYMVATGNPSAKVKILLDGAPIGANAGADVAADGTMTISADKLYKLVHLSNAQVHTLEIDVISGTLDAYTFTFG